MMSNYKCAVCIFGRYRQNNVPLALSLINYPLYDTSLQSRGIKKHYNQKFRKERAQKVIKVELPNFNEELTQDLQRTYMKKIGILPCRQWQERPYLINCTSDILESYVVPEGDGKFSAITTAGAKQKYEYLEKKGKSYMAIKKIKMYDEHFTVKEFPEVALEIYKKAHEALNRKDENELLQYVTEHAYPIMTNNLANKTIVWKFLESLEPAYVVHARVLNLITKDNMMAQVTVRFHTQQILCIYDRFGRLFMGSETVKKDVLDYVVFERHLSNIYGTWRIHGKIIPSWVCPNEVSTKTYALPKEEKKVSTTDNESIADTVSL